MSYENNPALGRCREGKLSRGECINCPARAVGGHRRCTSCAAKHRRGQRQRRRGLAGVNRTEATKGQIQ